MDETLVPVLLVSANVGSIFEDPQELLKIWLREFLLVVKRYQPKFIALHCQEVGGKNTKESMGHVEEFVRALMTSEELSAFGQLRIFLDEDIRCPEKYTALGSLYFVHNSLKNVQIWDFHGHKYLPLTGKEVYTGSIEHVGTKEKSKFPTEIFPESKWSRKGFMRTRWSIGHTIFDLVNIHLFHDASNFIAMEDFPSRYSKTRQNALGYLLQKFSTDQYEKVPFFIFGDFNFRLDTKGVIQKLTNQAVPVYVKSAKNGEVEKILYKDPGNENKVILTLEKKVFDLDRHEETFARSEKWLQEFDKEPKVFGEDLFEFDISFPPSYPFKEDTCSGSSYMRTRCPSWCDRILLSKSALSIVNSTPLDTAYSPIVYQLVGENVSMGDHKPVMLMFNLRQRTEGDHLRKSSQVFSV
ncbi:Type I inositol-1,4,5-trisphosphate 5-phosphatase, partial [Stegodyphus mimosarum]